MYFLHWFASELQNYPLITPSDSYETFEYTRYVTWSWKSSTSILPRSACPNLENCRFKGSRGEFMCKRYGHVVQSKLVHKCITAISSMVSCMCPQVLLDVDILYVRSQRFWTASQGMQSPSVGSQTSSKERALQDLLSQMAINCWSHSNISTLSRSRATSISPLMKAKSPNLQTLL